MFFRNYRLQKTWVCICLKSHVSVHPKHFSQPFTAFSKSPFNVKHFEKKDESHSLCLSEIIDCKIRAYGNT